MKQADTFAQRMKTYEDSASQMLLRRTPVIVRIDGKNFSKLTKKYCDKPFDQKFVQCMEYATHHLCRTAQNVKLAYFQSDEVSILMTDYKTIMTDAWFDNKVQKISSVSAGTMTSAFLHKFISLFAESFDHDALLQQLPSFDARCFNLPREEVTNYFIWRQRDAERNSVSMAASSYFSHNELDSMNREQKMDMLMLRKGINWNEYDTVFKRGACVVKKQTEHEGILRSRWTTDWEIPIFTRERDYVERYVYEEKNQASSVCSTTT